MEYPNQKGTPYGRDLAPDELPFLTDTPRLVLPEDTTGGCGCEGHTSPVMPLPEMPSCGVPTCCAPTCYPCGENSWGLDGYPLAMVYAPCQPFRNLYDLETALERGTLFSELDFPIETAGGAKGNGGGCGCGRAGNSRRA